MLCSLLSYVRQNCWFPLNLFFHIDHWFHSNIKNYFYYSCTRNKHLSTQGLTIFIFNVLLMPVFFQYFKSSCDKVGNDFLLDGEHMASTIRVRTISWVPYILCSPRFHVIPLWDGNIPNRFMINSSMVSEVTMAPMSTIVSHYFCQVDISWTAVSIIIIWLNFTILVAVSSYFLCQFLLLCSLCAI